MACEKAVPFESFAPVHTLLEWVGYKKLFHPPKSLLMRICYQLYRYLGVLVAVVVNLQHIIFMIQRRDNSERVFDCLMVEIPQVNLLVKYFTLNMQSRKVDKIYELLKSPIFAAENKNDEEFLAKNIQEMHQLCKILFIGLSFAAVFWPTYYFAKRYLDETAVVPSYVPFNTDTWSGFTLSVVIEVIPIIWIGYGHVGIDCLVATFYAHAQAQFKIMKHSLEDLFDGSDVTENGQALQLPFKYSDEHEEHVKRRFIHCVKRYEKIVWYVKEVDSIFNISTSFQFLTSTLSLCVVIYKMSMTNALTFPFIFLIALLLVLSTQVFLYCFYGNLVQHECKSVNDSIYLSDWTSASPGLRRCFLIAMVRWAAITTPRVCGIIPLSLTTFVSISRSAYSIYAVLTTRQA